LHRLNLSSAFFYCPLKDIKDLNDINGFVVNALCLVNWSGTSLTYVAESNNITLRSEYAS
jgi:hypothetical protein